MQADRLRFLVQCRRQWGFEDAAELVKGAPAILRSLDRLHALERAVRDAIEAMDRGSTTAPVLESLRVALGDQ